MGSIELYHTCKFLNSDTSKCIDNTTWDDLDMDDIFKRINVCQTSVGEEYLYNCLYEPHFEESRLLQRESFISRLKENPEERLQIQIYLSKMGKMPGNGLPELLFNPGILMKFSFIYNILAIIPLLCFIFMFINLSAGIFGLTASFIINTAVYMKTKQRVISSVYPIKYSSSLLMCCYNLLKIKSLQLQSENFIVQIQKLFKIFKPLMKRGSGVMQKYDDFIGSFYEYYNILFLSDLRSYNKVISGIAKNKEQFHELYKMFGEIDLSICVLSFRESLPFYSNPVFHGENCINFEEIYHPLISEPVANSGTIKNNSIITGSNASGKSTFIKSLAVNGILAQTIFTCTAKSFSGKFALVMTSMALRDDITEGESYFITEIKSLKRILDKIKTVYCVCYIDEILRGTNTIERIAASASVFNFLNGKNCLCVAASHDIELAQMLSDKLDNYHFREQITDDGMFFDYKFKQGISNTRNAIKLLRYMNFDKEIVENAENLVNRK